jgi:hypothetical protein
MKPCYCDHCNGLREILTNVRELLSMHETKEEVSQHTHDDQTTEV